MRAAFGAIVDYAGLFPPAELSLAEAAANYAAYRRSSDRWMLGRFVVRSAQLSALHDAVQALGDGGAPDPWPVSVVLGPEPLSELHQLPFGAPGALRVESVELRVTDPGEVSVLSARIPPGIEAYFEWPHAASPDAFCDLLQRTGTRGKIRTGGVTPEAFPPAATVAAFLIAVTQRGVPFKATAGLHHPLRGLYPLTYRTDSPRHTMFGFVNLLVATAVAMQRGSPAEVESALSEAELGAVAVSEGGIRWRERIFGPTELDAVRKQAFVGFGSCSFREPVDELATRAAA